MPPVNVPTEATLVYRFVELASVENQLVVVPEVRESVPSVERPVTSNVPAKEPLPPVKVPNVPALENRFVEEAVVVKNDVEVACVSVTLPLKEFTPVHVLVFARRVEDAAVTVTLEPRAKSVPLMVPSEPEISPEPIVVVDTSFPFSSVESRAEARKEKYCDPVDVAFTASVEEAMRRVPFSHSAVVVL